MSVLVCPVACKTRIVVANVPFGMPAVTIDNNGAIKLQEKGHVGNDK